MSRSLALFALVAALLLATAEGESFFFFDEAFFFRPPSSFSAAAPIPKAMARARARTAMRVLTRSPIDWPSRARA